MSKTDKIPDSMPTPSAFHAQGWHTQILAISFCIKPTSLSRSDVNIHRIPQGKAALPSCCWSLKCGPTDDDPWYPWLMLLSKINWPSLVPSGQVLKWERHGPTAEGISAMSKHVQTISNKSNSIFLLKVSEKVSQHADIWDACHLPHFLWLDFRILIGISVRPGIERDWISLYRDMPSALSQTFSDYLLYYVVFLFEPDSKMWHLKWQSCREPGVELMRALLILAILLRRLIQSQRTGTSTSNETLIEQTNAWIIEWRPMAAWDVSHANCWLLEKKGFDLVLSTA
jgi:hypothetical protein